MQNLKENFPLNLKNVSEIEKCLEDKIDNVLIKMKYDYIFMTFLELDRLYELYGDKLFELSSDMLWNWCKCFSNELIYHSLYHLICDFKKGAIEKNSNLTLSENTKEIDDDEYDEEEDEEFEHLFTINIESENELNPPHIENMNYFMENSLDILIFCQQYLKESNFIIDNYFTENEKEKIMNNISSIISFMKNEDNKIKLEFVDLSNELKKNQNEINFSRNSDQQCLKLISKTVELAFQNSLIPKDCDINTLMITIDAINSLRKSCKTFKNKMNRMNT